MKKKNQKSGHCRNRCSDTCLYRRIHVHAGLFGEQNKNSSSHCVCRLGSSRRSNTANTVPGARNATVSGEQLNGNWAITGDSRVYFSVDTTKEKVNFENDAVNGKWIINLNDAGSMKGQGSIDMSHINSGNEKRDRHLKEPDFFDIEKYPNAEFTASSFEGLLPEWQEGTAYDFTMNGVLTVRGIDKDVTFSGKALYENEQVKLSGTTYVTFGDFGLERPKSVLLSAEKDITVQLELVLKR